jgi:DNA-binding CsgD family transcriptional regulator
VTHWSAQLMSDHLRGEGMPVSFAEVARIWRDLGLQPHRIETFTFSTDPQLEAKICDVVGLYLDPPEKAAVVSIDEKSHDSGVGPDRTAATDAFRSGRAPRPRLPAPRHHHPFAALEVATGRITADACRPRHRNGEFLAFLKQVAKAHPKVKLHVACDNYGTHSHPNVNKWLARDPRITMHFAPTGASWMNMAEIFFGVITRQAMRGGTVTSGPDLIAAIRIFIDAYKRTLRTVRLDHDRGSDPQQGQPSKDLRHGTLADTPSSHPGAGSIPGATPVLAWSGSHREGHRVTLWGRRKQCGVLDGLLADVRAGRSRALVVRGEPGIGKTALLGYAADTAQDFQVARAEGAESEMELPFAALHQLCGRMLGRLDRLPGPQREALGVAFGLRLGSAPDRFLVGLAVLGLLSGVAADQPLLCLIDDAQWMDQSSAQALAFVARRLDAESVAMLFGTRDPAEGGDLTGIAELALEGLSDADARALLGSVLPGPLDERVRDRIIAESGGNPLALLELPHTATAAELAGGFGLPGAGPLSGRIEDIYGRRLAALPAATQQLLLLAAAEPTGDPALLWRAAGRLGIGIEAAHAAESEGMLEFGARLTFRHPLVRSAIYRSTSPRERRAAHRALAEATDPQLDPDRRALHRAHAAVGPDEDIAADLERSAGRAQARGGLAAAAAFLEQAARLTPTTARRGERALGAAKAKHQAGAPDAALALLATAQAGPLDELQRARVDLLLGQIAFAVNRGSDAPPLLLAAAKRFEPLDVGLARETYLDALRAALFVGRLANGGGVLEVARAARTAPASPQPPRAADLLLDGLVLLITEGYPAATPVLRRALSAFRSEDFTREEGLRWLWLACRAAANLWDDEAWAVLALRQVQLARDAGALTVLPIALNSRIYMHLNAGELSAAAALIEEAEAITEATGSQLAPYGVLLLAGWRGREAEASGLIEANLKAVVARGEGLGLTVIQWASAVLYNGLGRWEDALAAAQQASEDPHEQLFSTWAAVELIEAATRSGVPELVAGALERLLPSTGASGTDWALGIEARSRALISDGEAAERFYREAIDRLGRTRIRVELARAHLLYGEWLRRENRRIDAREQLRTAHQMLTSMGAAGFAERAERELQATGERVRKRTVDTPAQLTAREAQIARLAGDGLSNHEIAAQLFMSPRTVEYHLHKIFTKLAITSRNQLHRALAHGRSEESRNSTPASAPPPPEPYAMPPSDHPGRPGG